MDDNGQFLQMEFDYSESIWPWSGYFAVKISVDREAINFNGVVEGQIILTIESNTGNESTGRVLSELKLYVRAKIIAEPPRQQRILWDQYHNLRYPSGYFPRDDLKRKKNPLDWNADHVRIRIKLTNPAMNSLSIKTSN